ncbi:MAG: anaerobic ribonucleoside-triphosphate reductase activating protein [archaeon]
MFIAALQKTTLVDFPGKVACIVFLVNCNFKCKFCYNEELTSFASFKKGKRPLMHEEEIFSFLTTHRKMLDGVVITGGEPTISPGLLEFMQKIKEMGLLVKLDTNGTRPDVVKKVIDEKLADYFAMDIKAPLEKYHEITQVKLDPEKIKESIKLITSSKIPHEFRTTLYPSLTTQDLIIMAKLIPGEKYFLQHFQNKKVLDSPSRKLKAKPDEQVKEIVAAIREIVDVKVRE